MTRKQSKEPSPKDGGKKSSASQPVDVNDGIPDRAACPSRKRWLVAAGIYAAWALFLVYCLVAG